MSFLTRAAGFASIRPHSTAFAKSVFRSASARLTVAGETVFPVFFATSTFRSALYRSMRAGPIDRSVSPLKKTLRVSSEMLVLLPATLIRLAVNFQELVRERRERDVLVGGFFEPSSMSRRSSRSFARATFGLVLREPSELPDALSAEGEVEIPLPFD